MSQKSITISLNSKHLAEQIASDEITSQKDDGETKKTIWLRLADHLIIDGVPKEEISSKIIEMVEDQMRSKIKDVSIREKIRFNNSWFFTTMSENGYTSPDMARNSKFEPDSIKENSSIYTGLNNDFVSGIRNIKTLCNLLESSFRELRDLDNKPLDIHTLLSEVQIKNFLDEMQIIIDITKDCADNKTKIPHNTHHIFKHCLRVESGLFATAKTFLLIRLGLLDHTHTFITKKQATKFKNNLEPNILEIFTPHTRDAAIFMGFYGLECQFCRSWRTKETARDGDIKNLLCYDCDKTFTGKTVAICKRCQYPLYDDVLEKIKKSGTCPECKSSLILPKSFL